MRIVCFLLTVAGLFMAAAAILPLSEVATLARTVKIRRAWQVLAFIIITCVGLQLVATLIKLQTQADLSDVLAAVVHLLGPAFVLSIAWLSRNTARDFVRVADLERAARLDSVTGLPNRRHFDIQMAEDIQRARRSRRQLSLVVLDVDHFKHVNDTFGHRTGDLVLEQVAQLIVGAIKDTDIACRLGGDEFAVILSNLCVAQSRDTMERLRSSIENAYFSLAQGGTTRITASLGVAVLAANDTAETFVERADAALYASKRTGRNRVSLAA